MVCSQVIPSVGAGIRMPDFPTLDAALSRPLRPPNGPQWVLKARTSYGLSEFLSTAGEDALVNGEPSSPAPTARLNLCQLLNCSVTCLCQFRNN